jgi:hypothetical protein
MAAQLDELHAKAERAHAALLKAQEEARKAQEAADARRAAGLAAYDRNRLASYDEQEQQRQIADAEQRVKEAVLADPVWSAMVDLHAARVRAYTRSTEAYGDAARLGVTAPPTSAVAHEPGFDYIVGIITEQAATRTADEQEQRDLARRKAGDKAATE